MGSRRASRCGRRWRGTALPPRPRAQEEGLSYNQIIERVKAEHGVTLRKSHMSGWINGKHKPFGYVRAFDASPCAELAYVIGVSLGDASTSSSPSNYNHKIKLRVIDRRVRPGVRKVSWGAAGRKPPRVKWHEKTQSWHAELSSLLLMRFLRQELKELFLLILALRRLQSRVSQRVLRF